MDAVLEMKLPAVPGADDVHVALVEVLAKMDAFLADFLNHLGHLQACPRRAALMRALVAVGVVGAVVEDHADLDRSALDQAGAALGDVAFLANAYFWHSVLSCCSLPLRNLAGALPRVALPHRLRAGYAKVFAQCLTLIFGAVKPAALHFRYDQVGEVVERGRHVGRQQVETVGAFVDEP